MHPRWLLLALAWVVRGPEGVPTKATVAPEALVAEAALPGTPAVVSDPAALGRVARQTAAYLRSGRPDPAITPGLLEAAGVSMDDVLKTLDLVATTAASEPAKLQDPAFLREHFRVIRWTPDAEAAARKGVKVDHRIRLTRYLVYASSGSATRTATHDTALYAAPHGDDAEGRPSRLGHTRQDVYGGVYEAGGTSEGAAAPLVWLSRRDVNRALMQGTVHVQLDGGPKLYNVHLNNGIAYDRSVRDSNLQARYWYFREVDGFYGHGLPEGDKIRVEPGVTVAGDVYNLGLGKLVLLRYGDTARLAVLADTGGAFQPNLYQLDWFSGVYPTHEAFAAATREIPDRVEASFLVAR